MNEERGRDCSKAISDDYIRKRVVGSEMEYGSWNICFDGFDKGFLGNGGLLYVDCGHLEYASPECSNPVDAVIWNRAGDLIVWDFEKGTGSNKYMFRNTTDGKGHCHGAHESYGVERDVFMERIRYLIPFLVSRIIYTGNGSIDMNGNYQISQKAPYLNSVVSHDTTGKKPILNLREEPLTNKKNYMRFHVICGDANMSEVTEYLKLGTTSLVLDLLEDGKLRDIRLVDCLSSVHTLSCDLSLKTRIRCENYGEMTALDIQRVYLEAAESAYRGRDEMTDDILDRWGFVLDRLEEDPMQLDRMLDWVIKKRMIDAYREEKNLSLFHPYVRNIDLMYHEVDRGKGLFHKLQNAGLVDRLVDDAQIEHASKNPPKDTRAWIRGEAVKRGVGVGWEGVSCKKEKREYCGVCEGPCKVSSSGDRERVYLIDPLRNYSELVERL